MKRDGKDSMNFGETALLERRLLQEDSFRLKGHYLIELIGPDGQVKDFREGDNIICTVGKNQILKASSAEYLNQFKYMAVGTGITSISGATNATPIVITTTTAHGLADGQPVTISGVGGNTAANVSGYAKVTTFSSTTFGLYSNIGLTVGVAGNGSYTSGGIVVATVEATDTVLFNQLAISTAITPTNPSNPILQFQYTFAAGVATGAVTEAALFDAASSGNILSHLVFSVINVGVSDSLQVTYQIS